MSASPPTGSTLREPYDRRARNAAVLDAVVAALADRPSVTIVDLACGTGSTFARSAPRCQGAAELAAGRQRSQPAGARAAIVAPRTSPSRPSPIDLNRDLEAALDGPVDLVTTSALLDLVSDEWLRAARGRGRGAAAAGLCGAELRRPHRDRRRPIRSTQTIVAAVNAHQRTDKGFGPALGPAAAQTAIERFERVGYSVVQGASDWVFGPQDREIQTRDAVGLGRCRARDRRRAARPTSIGWLTRRRDLVAAGRSSIRVGHVDLFARPTGDALSRQVAVEQHLVVEPVHLHRRHAAPRRRARSAAARSSAGPEPRMIGATMMCSRSRQSAARKRDTVSAPPSISTRRRPRSASAARIAAGAICPSVLGRPTISMSDGNGGLRACAGHDQAAHAVVGEQLRAGRQPPAADRSRPAPAAGR